MFLTTRSWRSVCIGSILMLVLANSLHAQDGLPRQVNLIPDFQKYGLVPLDQETVIRARFSPSRPLPNSPVPAKSQSHPSDFPKSF